MSNQYPEEHEVDYRSDHHRFLLPDAAQLIKPLILLCSTLHEPVRIMFTAFYVAPTLNNPSKVCSIYDPTLPNSHITWQIYFYDINQLIPA